MIDREDFDSLDDYLDELRMVEEDRLRRNFEDHLDEYLDERWDELRPLEEKHLREKFENYLEERLEEYMDEIRSREESLKEERLEAESRLREKVWQRVPEEKYKYMFKVRLKELRVRNGLTQLEVANHLGVTVGNVQKFEYGQARPKFYNMIKIANLFNVSLDYLVGRTDNPNMLKNENGG